MLEFNLLPMNSYPANPQLVASTSDLFRRKNLDLEEKSMGYMLRSLKYFTVLAVGFSLLPVFTKAQHYTQTNLVSDLPGMAPVTDVHLVNPWGLTRSATSPWWVADNNSGFSTLYTGAGAICSYQRHRNGYYSSSERIARRHVGNSDRRRLQRQPV